MYKVLLLISILAMSCHLSHAPLLAIHCPPPPKGSYKKTCRNIQTFVQGNTCTLQANCDEGDPLAIAYLPNYHECPDGIANCSGSLFCGSCSCIPPSGSYQDTCKNIEGFSVVNPDNGKLITCGISASCRYGKNKWKSTSLAKACKPGEDISNCNGDLKCGNCD